MAINKTYAKAGVFTSLGTILFVILVVAANYLGYQHHRRIDLTANKLFSLSEQSIVLLKDLKKPVKVTCFFEESNEKLKDVKSLLKEYAYQSPKFKYEFIDPVSRPDLVDKFGIKKEGTIVIESGNTRQETSGTGEIDITSALLKMTRERKKKTVYFTEGHNEYDPDSLEETQGMSKFKEAIQKENLEVKKINLPALNTIPDDTAAIVIAGPKIPFLPEESDLLKKYFDNQGRLLILLDPPSSEGKRAYVPKELLEALGVKADEDFIIEGKSYLSPNYGVPIIQTFGWHQITKDFKTGIVLVGARSFTVLSPLPAGVTVEKLGETTAKSYGETDLTTEESIFDKDKDKEGPLIVALAIQKKVADTPATPAAPNEASAAPKQFPPEKPTQAEHPTPGSTPGSDASHVDENNPTPPPENLDNEESDSPEETASNPKEDEKPRKYARAVVIGDADLVSNAYLDLLGNADFLLNSLNWMCQEEELISIRPKKPDFQQLVISNEAWTKILMIVFITPLAVLAFGIYLWWKRR